MGPAKNLWKVDILMGVVMFFVMFFSDVDEVLVIFMCVLSHELSILAVLSHSKA